MNRAVVYVGTAVVLGLVMMLIPAWFFEASVAEYGKNVHDTPSARSEDLLPFLGPTEQNHIETFSYKEVEIFALSFVIASMVYVLFKRKTPEHEHVSSPFRQY